MVRSGEIWIRVDGETLLSAAIPQRSLAAWNPRYRLAALGNELSGDRPWMGEISSAIVRVGDRNLSLGRRFTGRPSMVLDESQPAAVLDNHLSQRRPLYALDGLLNLVCFIPFGFLLGASTRSRGWRVVVVIGTMFVVLAVGSAPALAPRPSLVGARLGAE